MRLFVRNKRGSLSLSMEAIVILILAVVMLGLGLTFVRTMFTSITDRATTAIDIADLSARPTEADPITFTPASPEVREGRELSVQVGFYNPHLDVTDWYMRVYDNNDRCGGITGFDADGDKCSDNIYTLYTESRFSLQKDDVIGWNIIFKPADNAAGGSATRPYLLTVKFCEDPGCDNDEAVYQREIVLTVRA